VELCRQLSLDFPAKTVFLQGNHDWAMAEHLGPEGPFPPWLEWGGRLTLQQYRRYQPWLAEHGAWLGQRPRAWHNEYVRFSHAGFAYVPDALDPANNEGVLWRRGPLRNTGQLQVVGHTPTASHQPEYDAISNTIYLDTGVADGHCLTALRLSETGGVLDTVVALTYALDYR
jgi:serine/threonine protein phosphatase 1